MAEIATTYGKLLIVGKELSDPFLEFPIDKQSILIGRDHSCDIRIVNKEISRKHAELYIENETVYINSMGREPVSVNSRPITSPQELTSGDKIEVHLDGRTRVFYFQGDDETVAISRAPLAAHNTASSAKSPTKKGMTPRSPRKTPKADKVPVDGDNLKKKMPPPPPPPLPKAAAGAGADGPQINTACARPTLSMALQEAIKTGVQLKKVAPASDNGVAAANEDTKAASPAAVPAPVKAVFCPNPADLLNIKAALRKTDAPQEEETNAAEQVAQMVQERPDEDIKEETQEDDVMEEDAQLESDPQEQQVETDAPVQEVEAMEEDGQAEPVPMSTAKKMKKNVRFDVEQGIAGTPEGAANDATITIRLRKGDLEQIVNIDDNTVAFSEWGLGTMGAEGAEEEPLPDTVVSKRSRRLSEAVSVGGSVMKQTPVRSKLQSQLMAASGGADKGPASVNQQQQQQQQQQQASVKDCTPASMRRRVSMPVSVAKGTTPAPNGTQAPACTPATVGATASVQKAFRAGSSTMDPATLASRLAELAQENDVTFELPFDLFGSTPFASAKKTINVTVTPKSVRPSSASATKAMASVPRTVPRSTTKLTRVEENEAPRAVEEADQEEASPMMMDQGGEVIENTEVLNKAAVQEAMQAIMNNILITLEQQEEDAQEVEKTEEQEDVDNKEEEEVAPPTIIADAAPPTSTRKSRGRRSISRTPGTKIAIIERGVADGPSSVKPSRPSFTAAGGPTPVAMSTLAMEQGGSRWMQQEQEQGAGMEAQDESCGNEQAIEETVQHQDDVNVAVVAEQQDHIEEADEDVEEMEEEEDDKQEEPTVLPPKQPVSASEYRKMVLKARAYHTRAMQLDNQLKAMSARTAKLRRAATGLAAALCHERSMRKELQEAMQQIVANREAAQMAEEEEEEKHEVVEYGFPAGAGVDAMEVEGEGSQVHQQRVVVVGYTSPAKSRAVEMAGQVVVLRPNAGYTSVATAAAVPTVVAPPPTVARSSKKTPARRMSVRRTPAKTPGTAGTVVVDDVEVPEWVFDPQAGIDASAELAVVEKEEHAKQEEEIKAVDEIDAELDAAVAVADESVPAAVSLKKASSVKKPKTQPTPVAQPEPQLSEEDEEEDDDDVCHACGCTDEGDVLLLCDGCDNACHLGCCNPVLKRVPKGDWFCVECTQKKEEEAGKAKTKQTNAPARGKAAAAPKRGRPAAADSKAADPKKAKTAAAKAEEQPKPAGKGKTRKAAEDAAPTRSTRTRR